LDGILLAGFGAGVIEVRAAELGDGEVGLFDAAEEFFIEGFAEGIEVFRELGGVGVFGFEVGGDGGVLLFAEPEVGIVEGGTVAELRVLDTFGDGGGLGLEEGG